ncbi:MAG: Crp/Fnr family transcriptional regulator [Saprospiraceae bacterium]
MNHFSLKSFLTTNLSISEDELDAIQKSCIIKNYPKDAFLLRENEHCRHILFVEEGLLKQYAIDEKGKEHILHFATEGWFLTDRESVYFHQPSKYFIQTLEPSRIAFIDDGFLQKLEKKSAKFRDFYNLLLHEQIRYLQARVMMLMSQTAEERYLQFTKTYPDILLRIPQTMVAAYLGIALESLSRVRKELAFKNFRNITT